jgi:hypothetical protein
MKTDIIVTEDKLDVICTGPFRQADIVKVIDAIDEARKNATAIRKCLMDITGADFQLGGIGEYFIGEYASKKLAGIRISLITNKGQINKLLENAAYNRGLKILVTDARSEAEGWLKL